MDINAKESLRQYLFGALDIFEEDGWICFSRFTDNQGIWLKNNGFPRDRYSTSGMRMEFETRGGLLAFDYHAEQSTRSDFPIFGLEITVDGLPSYHLYKEELPLDDKIEFIIPEADDFVHVAVYFPLRASLKIKNVVFPDDAQCVKKNLKILTLGDSITAGAVCKHANHCYVNILADKLNAELLNQGVGGARFFPDFLEKLPFCPDIVTVAYGVNDFIDGVLFTEIPNIFYEKLYSLYKEKKIIVLLPIWYGLENANNKKTLEQGRKYIKEIAEQYPNISVIDCKEFVPHLAEFYWDSESLHPNDLGFLYYGNNLFEKIKDL